MYTSFFGLSKKPFSMTPDPAFLFLTAQHREALAGLTYAVLDRKGFLSLSGMAGTGKTTLLASLLKNLNQSQVRSSVILNPMLTPDEFLESAMIDFGIPEIPPSKARRLHMLREFLTRTNEQGQICSIIVDEAHKLSPALLEEIRLLGNYEQDDRKLLQILLLGQSELDEVLNRPELWQLKQRISVRLALRPLAATDIAEYIAHRWKKAGGAEPQPFSPEAIGRIATYSQGIPRLINSICDNALMLAFADSVKTVTADHVENVARDLQLAPNAAPAQFAAAPAPHAVPVTQTAAALSPQRTPVAANTPAPAPPVVIEPLPAPVSVSTPSALGSGLRIKALERYAPAPAKTSFFARLASRLGFTHLARE